MKIVKIVLVLFLLGCSFSAISQRKIYFSGMAFQEFDMLSKNRPFGVATCSKLGSFLLQAEYRHNVAQMTKNQLLASRDSYGARIGLMDGGNTMAGFSIGYQKIETFKKLLFNVHEEPADINGDRIEDFYNVNAPLSYSQFSLGIHLLVIKKYGSRESMLDDYDKKRNKDAVNFGTIFLTFEMMYAPKLNFSNTFDYSPYGAYVTRELHFTEPIKQKHFGFKMRLEYTTPLKIGLIVDMGVFPGVCHKTSGYNDFNLGIKFGAMVNLSVFSKEKTK